MEYRLTDCRTGAFQAMDDDKVYDETNKLQRLTLRQLQRRYCEVYGEGSRTRHKHHLIRRVAWRLQVLQKGDLSERARQRALEIARDAYLRVVVPQAVLPTSVGTPPPRTANGKRRRGKNAPPDARHNSSAFR
jgi:hypothetical protein